jgi:hypothetical protein
MVERALYFIIVNVIIERYTSVAPDHYVTTEPISQNSISAELLIGCLGLAVNSASKYLNLIFVL